MARPGGLLSPSYKEEEGVAVQIKETQRKSPFSLVISRGQRMPLSGRPLGFPPAWGARGPSRGARVV